MNNHLKQVISRFFDNKYSRNDYLRFKELLLEQEELLEEQIGLHWDEYQNQRLDRHKDLSEIYTRIDREIETSLREARWQKWVNLFSRVAAVLILPITLTLGILFFHLNEYLVQEDAYVEVRSPAGVRTSLNLPDGSMVWLNGGSCVRYPAIFNESRVVEMEGEAFFKVKSSQDYPFFVSTKNISIKATGTEFNVLAYHDESRTSVILKEGKVDVLDVDHHMIQKMEAGYQLQYCNESDHIEYSRFNVNDYSDWINGKLIFQNSSMEEVVRRMEHWYGVKIKIMDKELEELHFKATFTHENIEDAFKLLQSTKTFNYWFEKKQIKSDGSYENTKIFISKE